MPIYKVSYVIRDSEKTGGIVNLDTLPKIGDTLSIADDKFEVLEVVDLLPPRGDFRYIHVTCKFISAS